MSRAKKLTTEELFNHLFGACNILRGPINQDDYKTCNTILFFKEYLIFMMKKLRRL